MKKNVSINIGGIIFHVEEDGYEKLKNYLATINSYFADFQESQEIVSDIENRIAEIFLAKLKEDKQVINEADVEALIESLGSIEDFKKAEQESEPEAADFSATAEEPFAKEANKKLLRDTKRKILGGVAAGLAHYFSIDALWIRLALITLTALAFATGFGGVVLPIAYLICWIFIPADPFIDETEKVKKLYRAKDGEVIAGVAKGLAAYLGADVAIIRLLFVLLLIPGFAGFFIYLVLWLITPKANSLTEKMQMEGTPITLSNIEKSIKSNFKSENGEESVLVKVLLFPFRLAAIVLNGLAKILGPVLNVVVNIIRIFVGVVLILVGLILGSGAFVLGMFNQGWLLPSAYMHNLDFPLEIIMNSISVEQNIVSFLLLIIPALFLTIAGISVMAKQWVLNKTLGFSLLGVYIVSLIIGAVMTINIVLQFPKKDTITETRNFNLNGNQTLVLKTKNIGYDDYRRPRLTLEGYDGSNIQLEIKSTANGFSKSIAQENAKMMYYEVNQEADSILIFDEGLRFNEDAVFRNQRLAMTLYLPYNQPFRMTRRLGDILRNTIYRNGYSAYQIPNNDWAFTEDGLQCLSCEEDKRKTYKKSVSDNYSSNEGNFFYVAPFEMSSAATNIYYDFDDFNEVRIATGIFAEIRQGSEHSVEIVFENIDRAELEEELIIKEVGDKLKIYYEGDFGRDFSLLEFIDNGFKYDFDFNRDRPKIKAIVTLPVLQNLEASSASVFHLYGFEQQSISFDLSSSAVGYVSGNYNRLNLGLSSTARVYAQGSADKLRLNASSAAQFKGFDLVAKEAVTNASSAARVEVTASGELKANASSAGKIRYRDVTNLSSNASSGGSIRRE